MVPGAYILQMVIFFLAVAKNCHTQHKTFMKKKKHIYSYFMTQNLSPKAMLAQYQY